MSDAPVPVLLKDYTPFSHIVEHVALTFDLRPDATEVTARIAFRPNPDGAKDRLRLDGENLDLIWARVDGKSVQPDLHDGGLIVDAPDAPFVWEACVRIDPASNTALEGLYISNGMYCTQCEAEGFRKITYYPDRPDVMAPFDVRINSELPVLLSNGNPGAVGAGFAEWHDPHPKPAYLFALVAGDLVAHSDRFTTMDGREVALNIWVRAGDLEKCAYAMDALKRAMTWDERVYGRAYDLDVFNVVAVDDFNMGAMENKGLNIFNARYVLASPETATDDDYARIESIIAHEYFHNWTGNRITCRDWFQLCLKEGLTVYRDQQFSGDERSHAVQRIDDVQALRGRQFREDAGPLAHPVRPEEYIEINNFYTATVYEKGAELIGMLRALVGDDTYAKALDLYFTRHDGQACTIEDWLACFADVSGRDLAQFKLWYQQAGTPLVVITVEETGRAAATRQDSSDRGSDTIEWKAKARQTTPPTPGQPVKKPLLIPIRLALYDRHGNALTNEPEDRIVELAEEEMVLARGSSAASDGLPIVSALRGFSAPVILRNDMTAAERAVLLTHDIDPFNKWEAGRRLAKDALVGIIRDSAEPDPTYLDALAPVLRDDALDPAFRARLLGLPSDDDMAQTLARASSVPDPDAIAAARDTMVRAMAARLEADLTALYRDLVVDGPYRPSAEDAGKRALRNAALSYLTRIDGGDRARTQFDVADNLTDSLGALVPLIRMDMADDALSAFYTRWQDDRLVLDKWFSIQVAAAPGTTGVGRAQAATEHADFDWKNPNRFRSVIGALGTNHASFHKADGSGYALVADWLIRLDPVNPQTAARMTTLFETRPRYDVDRQDLMRLALQRIADTPDLSRDTTEMVGRMLNA